MPAELRPNWKRKVNAAEVRQKKMKVVNVEETLKALEQKEISRKRKENDNHAVKEETKSDNENDEVSIWLSDRRMQKNEFVVWTSRKMSKTRNKTMKWTRITIMDLVTLTMATITMMKTIIWTMDRFIRFACLRLFVNLQFILNL